MKILICCADGMSSSLLVQKMREEVKSREIDDVKIGSCTRNQVSKYIDEADVLLLAPQVSFIASDIDKHHNIKVMIIDHKSYGLMDGKTILDNVLHWEAVTIEKSSLNLILDYISKSIISNRVVTSITLAFTSIFPVTFLGSILMLIYNLPLKFWIELMKNSSIGSSINMGIFATTGAISLYIVFFIAYHFVHTYNIHARGAGLLAMICFFLVCGNTHGRYQTTFFGANGLFSAIIIGLIVGRIYAYLIHKNWKIVLPGKVPGAVLRSFEVIIPTLVILSIFTLITYFFSTTKYGDINTFIYTTIQSSLTKFMGNNIISAAFIILAANGLWFFGIHGGNITGSITSPIYTTLSLENFNAFQNGEIGPNIINLQFGRYFVQGGVGSTLSLVIIMLFFAKSHRLKSLAKLSLPTSIFFINEPVMFGMPIVLNPIFIIPILFITPILAVITYIVIKIGIIPTANGITLPWTTPPIIYGLLQGSWKIALWELLTMFLSGIMWYPFFKMADNKAFDEENN